jgi:hypothetical protein
MLSTANLRAISRINSLFCLVRHGILPGHDYAFLFFCQVLTTVLGKL